jgi:hypothetical protein
MAKIPTRLGQILLARSEINGQQLQQALEYQSHHRQPLGDCLLALGFIDQRVLDRALRRQSWLKPCAAWLTCMCAPFTLPTCFANETSLDPVNAQWSDKLHLNSEQIASVDVLKIALQTAWEVYQGEAKSGEWRYGVSKQNSGYSVSLQMHF